MYIYLMMCAKMVSVNKTVVTVIVGTLGIVEGA